MKRVYIILLLATQIFCGCIKEDQSKCFRSLYTLVKFKYEEHGVDAFGEHISSVSMYVFNNDDGRFVCYQYIDQLSLNRLCGTELDLPNGKYRVVCFANAQQRTLCPTLTQSALIDDLTQAHVINANPDQVSGDYENGDRLFYAPRNNLLPFVISVSNQPTTSYTLYFRTAHVEVDIYLSGFEDQFNLSPIVELTNITPEYDFKLGTFGEPVTYKQTAHQVSIQGVPTQVATFNTPLFAKESNIEVIIRNASTNQIVQTINLIEFIETNYDSIDLSSDEEVKIEIAIAYINGNVTISIPKWKDYEIIPQI